MSNHTKQFFLNLYPDILLRQISINAWSSEVQEYLRYSWHSRETVPTPVSVVLDRLLFFDSPASISVIVTKSDNLDILILWSLRKGSVTLWGLNYCLFRCVSISKRLDCPLSIIQRTITKIFGQPQCRLTNVDDFPLIKKQFIRRICPITVCH